MSRPLLNPSKPSLSFLLPSFRSKPSLHNATTHSSRSYAFRSPPPPPTDSLYGASVVLAALHSSKRRPKKLFVRLLDDPSSRKSKTSEETKSWTVEKPSGSGTGLDLFDNDVAPSSLIERAVQLARKKGVEVKAVPLGKLDSMSGGRPHQGMILQANALQPQQLGHLGPMIDIYEGGEHKSKGYSVNETQ
ncbi:hypothetical protein HK097_009697 [Rhizophlyctis rosea]|uniref:RNA 2-O ribose methyltransferase substrate binding domain-containing protein n=1 Tax=Rhizophlyctis rosea TaxID=64517 RepID=A0AAD5SGK4_9FUNG|nr:hypothetical protein HK097_009697 [Rhizophlyctis rosea]